MNIDGSGLTNITNHPGDETGYSWIPVLADLCPDTPDPVSAQVRPGKCVTQGEVLIIDIYGFQPREAITVTVSAPDGQSNSTDSVVGPDGTLNNLGYPTETMVPGLWTVEFTGLASGHTATVYFRVSVP
jgi:hypothetical protein